MVSTLSLEESSTNRVAGFHQFRMNLMNLHISGWCSVGNEEIHVNHCHVEGFVAVIKYLAPRRITMYLGCKFRLAYKDHSSGSKQGF